MESLAHTYANYGTLGACSLNMYVFLACQCGENSGIWYVPLRSLFCDLNENYANAM